MRVDEAGVTIALNWTPSTHSRPIDMASFPATKFLAQFLGVGRLIYSLIVVQLSLYLPHRTPPVIGE